MGSGKYSERRVTDVYSDGSDRSGLFCELVGMDTHGRTGDWHGRNSDSFKVHT